MIETETTTVAQHPFVHDFFEFFSFLLLLSFLSVMLSVALKRYGKDVNVKGKELRDVLQFCFVGVLLLRLYVRLKLQKIFRSNFKSCRTYKTRTQKVSKCNLRRITEHKNDVLYLREKRERQKKEEVASSSLSIDFVHCFMLYLHLERECTCNIIITNKSN